MNIIILNSILTIFDWIGHLNSRKYNNKIDYNTFDPKMQSTQSTNTTPNKAASGSNSKSTRHLRYSDFQSIKILGNGAYGKVQLVQKNGIKYALKIISKKLLQKQGKQYQAFVEKQLMSRMEHPGVVQFKTCFQDKYNLYFCLEFCEGGDFTTFIKNNQHKISHKLRVFYVAEIVSIIQYFQKIGIVHRDLKPQNILLSEKGHLKIIDFGTAQISDCEILDQKFKLQLLKQKQESQKIQSKPQQWTPVKNKRLQNTSQKSQSSEQGEQQLQVPQFKSERRRKATFVGTCFYVPPELIQNSACYPSADLWALGCIIYQLYYLNPPFDGVSQFQIFQKIKNIELLFPQNDKITDQAIDLIKKLLQKNPNQRLGCNSREGLMMKDLKMHPFFKGINFQTLYSQQVPLLWQEQQTVSEEEKEKMKFLQNKVMKQYLSLLQDNPNILMHGLIEKRTFIIYNLYYLIVFNNLKMLRIKIVEPGKTRECEIDLQQKQGQNLPPPAQILNSSFFKLTTKQKTYKLKTTEPAKWVTTINKKFNQLKQQRKKSISQKGNNLTNFDNQMQSVNEMLKGIKISLFQ